jgi:hypothetical protein
MKYWQTPEFKALQKAWYERLEADGFVDHEELNKGDLHLKPQQHDDTNYRRYDHTHNAAKVSYFLTLTQHVYQHQDSFKREVDRQILTLYVEGKNIKEIVAHLKDQGMSRNRDSVRCIIMRHEHLWGLKTYTYEQMYMKSKTG